MPELPEVETMRRGILPLLGRQIADIERPPCKRRPIAIQPRLDVFRRRTVGKTIVAIDRAGKRVVIWLATTAKSTSQKNGRNNNGANNQTTPGEEAIVIEPRMTGLVLLADPPTQEHLRFRIQLSNPAVKNARNGGSTASKNGRSGKQTTTTFPNQLLFWDRRGLGTVTLLSAAEYAAKFQGERATLGPDALQLLPNQLGQRLRTSRRHVKVALLDQRAVAGVGNLYASEILHVAAVHPAARCDRLREQQWLRIHAAIQLVLAEAIRHEGSTLSDGTYRNALNESGGYQNHHRVYDRAGQPCLTCHGGSIQRIVQAQRSTFFCSACQRR